MLVHDGTSTVHPPTNGYAHPPTATPARWQDYRLAKRDDGNCKSLCGTPAYVPPEMVRGETQTLAVDWWGLGVLLHELTTRESPWGPTDADEASLLKRIAAHLSGHLAVSELISQVIFVIEDVTTSR